MCQFIWPPDPDTPRWFFSFFVIRNNTTEMCWGSSAPLWICSSKPLTVLGDSHSLVIAHSSAGWLAGMAATQPCAGFTCGSLLLNYAALQRSSVGSSVLMSAFGAKQQWTLWRAQPPTVCSSGGGARASTRCTFFWISAVIEGGWTTVEVSLGTLIRLLSLTKWLWRC